MKYLISFLIVINSIDISACLSASQNRIFPLGVSTEGLLVVEFHLFRSESINKNNNKSKLEVVWGGAFYQFLTLKF